MRSSVISGHPSEADSTLNDAPPEEGTPYILIVGKRHQRKAITLGGLTKMCDPTIYKPVDVERVMKQFDSDRDGKLNFAEYTAMMLETEKIRNAVYSGYGL